MFGNAGGFSSLTAYIKEEDTWMGFLDFPATVSGKKVEGPGWVGLEGKGMWTENM